MCTFVSNEGKADPLEKTHHSSYRKGNMEWASDVAVKLFFEA